jgi:hypothetical protein
MNSRAENLVGRSRFVPSITMSIVVLNVLGSKGDKQILGIKVCGCAYVGVVRSDLL